MDRKDLAMRVAAKLDDEWEREVAGLQSYDWARRSLLELADEWLGEVKLKVEEKTWKQKAQLIGRALKDLNLRVVAGWNSPAGRMSMSAAPSYSWRVRRAGGEGTLPMRWSRT